MDLNCTITFQKNYDALFNSDKRFLINQGSSRSSKTWSLCQLLIVYALKTPNKTISIVRKTFPTLRATVMRDFFSVMKEMNLYNRKNHNKTENIYTFENGTLIEFFSTDDEQKLRGRKRDICWVNEANELFHDDFLQLNMRTTEKFIVDYNPSDADSWIYELDSTQSIIIKSTYKDNPFLQKSIVKQIEDLKYKDDALYQIYALGERATSRKNVYQNWTFLNEKPSYFTNYIYGLDFGYNHPTALAKVYYFEDELFIETLIYESYLTTPELIEKMKGLNLNRTTEIMCDYSRPEIIADLNDNDFNAQNANKSVKEGINNVKTFKIFGLDTDKDLKKEYNNYMWKKIGERILDEPVKNYDDCFVADTLITTDKGHVKIVDVKVGDMVLTSTGYRKVLHKFYNGKKLVSDFSLTFNNEIIILSCTSNHKIKTQDNWIEISLLESETILYKNNQEIKLLSIEVNNERYEETYDLTVEETHEFFANGILVHNCMDAIRYATFQIKDFYYNSTPLISF